jgi:thermitase
VKRFPALALAGALLAALGSAAPPAAAGRDAASDRAARPTVRLIVAHRAGTSARVRSAVRAQAGARLERRFSVPGLEVVEVDADRANSALAELGQDPRVRYAEHDAPVRAFASDLSGQLWGLQRIGGPAAWAGSKGAGVTVAVVDTGIYAAHEDFQGRVVTGRDFVGPEPPDDLNGHGSHVSGTIAADDDQQGVVGVAPEARIMPLRALDADGFGSLSTIVAAFDFAGQHGVPIVNASLGGDSGGQPLDDVMRAHPNTLFVVAAGNGDPDGIGDDVDVTRTFPCASPAPNLVCVGASNQSDARASFSNFGARSVDLFAPGVDILSDWTTVNRPDFFDGGSPFRSGAGTSFATPQASGVAALILAHSPSLSALSIKNALLAGVDPVAAFDAISVSGGRLNALRALTVAPGDGDGDGIGDSWDICAAAADPAQADADADGIGDACDDGDADGVVDARDRCPTVAALHSIDGCVETIDGDGDGLPDRLDRCPTLPGGGTADGCPLPPDRDGDGVPDATDRCADGKGGPPSGCPAARITSVSARARRCAARRRCVRVRVRLVFEATVTATLQRRRCAGGKCGWKRYIAKTVAPSDTDVIVSLVATARRPLRSGRYRVRVGARTPGGRSPVRRAAVHVP